MKYPKIPLSRLFLACVFLNPSQPRTPVEMKPVGGPGSGRASLCEECNSSGPNLKLHTSGYLWCATCATRNDQALRRQRHDSEANPLSSHGADMVELTVNLPPISTTTMVDKVQGDTQSQTATMSTTSKCDLIVSELLCFVQNRMSNIGHEILVKTIRDYYGDKEIETAKKCLFDTCQQIYPGDLRFKKRTGPNKSPNNVNDIITKLNEASSRAPNFVAKDISHIPPLNMDLFDMSKMLHDISELQK